MSDFWKTLAGNSSSQLLTGSMDSLLSGRAHGEDFEKMRVLTDVHREANALELPIEDGTKVSFLGTLGAYMGYENPPLEGSVGEVVSVKSANGDVTYHEGKVFVQWDDGEFRSIHAEHLRLASVKSEKTAPTSKTARDQTLMTWTYHSSDGDGGKTTTITAEIKVDGRGNLMMEEKHHQEDWGGAPDRSHTTTERLGTVRDPDLQTASRIFSDKRKGWTAKGRRIRSPIQYLKKVLGEQSGRLASDKTTKTSREKAPKLPTGLEKSTQREWTALQRVVKGRTDYRKFTAAYDAFEIKSREDWGTDQKAMNAVSEVLDWVKAAYERKSGNDWRTGRPKKASDIKQQFEKIKGMVKEKPDNDFLKSLLKQMADKGFAPTDKQMAVVKKIEGEIKQQGQMKKELKTLAKKGEFDATGIGKKQSGPLSYDPEDKAIMGHFGQGDLHDLSDIAKSANFSPRQKQQMRTFKKQNPWFNELSLIKGQRRTFVGAGRFMLKGRTVGLMAKAGLVETYESQWADSDKTVELTSKGARILHQQEENYEDFSNRVTSASFRVASLGDLTDFLKSADGQLIHKSTNDLWSFTADGDGFTITRLFNDNGDPLKG